MRRSANREQQTLPGGLRTPAEKDVLFCKDQVAYDAVTGETEERCCWWCWVLGAGEGLAASRGTWGAIKVALQGRHGVITEL